MDVSRTSAPPRCRIAVTGELDLATAHLLRSALARELAGVTFMDSSGLHVVTWAHDQAALAGGRLLVVGRSRQVAQLLRVTRTGVLLS